ncbi:hypothetical protein GYMLUDRAFT_921873 [Collybiopsis luxurians FD-317 M1]|uniref:Uncharacterized protein n=1 Tax=Collybiopsis luxurians FD-317 M1 TaxID=944289 RepID=A0A0D0BH25_9AGAR|nr:hypothetical protein GYMLUDRAFT_921873 [Collybiopsis luxurians FD-317 M1]
MKGCQRVCIYIVQSFPLFFIAATFLFLLPLLVAASSAIGYSQTFGISISLIFRHILGSNLQRTSILDISLWIYFGSSAP